MLPILRDEQLRSMEHLRRDEFRRGLVSILDRHCPGWQQGDAQAAARRLDDSLAAARARGILGQRATAKHMIFSMTLGERFEAWLAQHWHTPELRAGSLTPDARMELLADELLLADAKEGLPGAE